MAAFARDLVAERRSIVRTAGPTPPPGEPPAQMRRTDGDFARTVELVGAADFHALRHPTLAVILDDDKASALMETQEDAQLMTIQACTGLYFNTYFELSGSAVWKSIETRQITAKGDRVSMHIFKADDGWYCSNYMWQTKTQQRKYQNEVGSELVISFWASGDKDGSDVDIPSGPLHFPWWHPKPFEGMDITAGYDLMLWSHSQVNAVQQAAYDPSGTGDGGGTGADDVTSGGDAPSAYGSSASSRAYESAPERGLGGHAGWMARAAALIRAYEQEDFAEFERLVTEYRTSAQLRKLLDRT